MLTVAEMGGPTNSRSQSGTNRGQRAPTGQREGAAHLTAPFDEAIQTGFGTLLALQASLARVELIPGDQGRVEASLIAAIELVRLAISDLRESIQGSERRPLSLGFVSRPRVADAPK
jgi:hypothetical protein